MFSGGSKSWGGGRRGGGKGRVDSSPPMWRGAGPRMRVASRTQEGTDKAARETIKLWR